MSKKTKDLDSLANYFQNAIAQAANMGAFSFGVSTINELTQMNNQGTEIHANLNEKSGTAKEKDAPLI